MLKIRYFCFYWAFRWYITGSFVTQILITTQTSYHGFVGDLRVQTEDYKQDVHFLIWCSLQYVQTMGWYVHIRRRKRFSTPVVKVQSWLDGFYCAFDCSVCICMWNGTLCAHPPFPPLPLSPSPPSCAPPPPPLAVERQRGVLPIHLYLYDHYGLEWNLTLVQLTAVVIVLVAEYVRDHRGGGGGYLPKGIHTSWVTPGNS